MSLTKRQSVEARERTEEPEAPASKGSTVVRSDKGAGPACAHARQASPTENEGPTARWRSAFGKLMNPQHTAKSRDDRPETVHWHSYLHHRAPIKETGREEQVKAGRARTDGAGGAKVVVNVNEWLRGPDGRGWRSSRMRKNNEAFSRQTGAISAGTLKDEVVEPRLLGICSRRPSNGEGMLLGQEVERGRNGSGRTRGWRFGGLCLAGREMILRLSEKQGPACIVHQIRREDGGVCG